MVKRVKEDFFTCSIDTPYCGRPMVEVTSVMQRLPQLRKWIKFYNKKGYYWKVKETYETKSKNIGYILCREITADEHNEVMSGKCYLSGDMICIKDYLTGKIHPKEKRS